MIVPRAKLTVLTCASSVRALLSILAAASEEENRAGKAGRCRGVLLKKSGLGGCSAAALKLPAKARLSRLYLMRGFTRGRLVAGSEVGGGPWISSAVRLRAWWWWSGGGCSEVGVTGYAALLAERPRVALRERWFSGKSDAHIDGAKSDVCLPMSSDSVVVVARTTVLCLDSSASVSAACTTLGS